MYRRSAQGWSKHLDFFIIDEVVLQVAFVVATLIRHNVLVYELPSYRIISFVLALSDAVVFMLNNSMHNVIKRGYLVELIETMKHCALVLAIELIYVFFAQTGNDYSRIIILLTFSFHVVFGYTTRVLWKLYLKVYRKNNLRKRNMLVVVDYENASDLIKQLNSNFEEDYIVKGIILTDNDSTVPIDGCPVVTNIDDASNYICREWIDSVYIDSSFENVKIKKLMNDCLLMAVPVHYHIRFLTDNVKRFSEKIGKTTVLTTSINYATPLQLAIKRLVDIIGGIVGSLLALFFLLIIGPLIKIKSPGPILFKQERIGKNGKKFIMYKIRSMVVDADSKKKEYLNQNRVKDGMMFKLDFDPRIIGNKILPDGTKKTGIGEFIRKTSIDELPQFFNVLKGDMSIVGTRPPTIDEWEKYEYHHRARLAVMPGITGMWQVEGRSEITDFEEVVKLDTSYLLNWSLSLDFKILIKTFIVVISRKGAA